MRFRRIRIHRFGRLRGFDTGEDELSNLVVVHAGNEGGKTTLFNCLTTLLYGFRPASRDQHPYVPWDVDTDTIDAEAEVELDSDESVRLHRRLLANPWGQLTQGETVTDLRNNPVPWAEHVHRDLFEQAYALTLQDMGQLHTEAWQQVQDRLLGAMGAEDLRPARLVAKELDDEASGLWRPDRRGKPQARQLQDRLAELRRARQSARDNDRDIRQKADKLAKVRSRLTEIRERERPPLKAFLERARTLKPIRDQLRRIEALEAEAGDLNDLEQFPSNPHQALADLEAQQETLRDEIEELHEEKRRHEEEIEAYTDADRAIVERRQQVNRLAQDVGAIMTASPRLERVQSQIEQLERQRGDVGRELFADPSTVDDDEVLAFPLGELRQRLDRYLEQANTVETSRYDVRSRESTKPPSVPGPPWAPLIPVGIGTVGTVWGLVSSDQLWILIVGATVTIAGISWLGVQAVLRSWHQRHAAALAEARESTERAERDAESLRQAVAELISDLDVAPAHIDSPSSELVHRLERYQEHTGNLASARSEEAALTRQIDEAEGRLQRLQDQLGMDLPDDFAASVHELKEALATSERRKTLADQATEGMPGLETKIDDLQSELEDTETEHEDLVRRLKDVGTGDLEAGIDTVERRMAARDRADGLREELVRAHPDLDEKRQRIREAEESGEDWTTDEEAQVRADDRLEKLNGEETDLVSQESALTSELNSLASEPTPDQIEGEIAAVEEELTEVCRQRDRLCLLAQVVRQADKRFREEHQPDLLRRAGSHLATITGGRYDRLFVPEDATEGQGQLYIRSPETGREVPVDEPISTGTRDQIYFALRLAIIDHLDEGQERLPLFVDEALVNWDAERLERGVDLLRQTSRHRQIFVFTLYESLLKEFEERGARLFRIDPAQ